MTNAAFMRLLVGGCGLVTGAVLVLGLRGAALADHARIETANASARPIAVTRADQLLAAEQLAVGETPKALRTN